MVPVKRLLLKSTFANRKLAKKSGSIEPVNRLFYRMSELNLFILVELNTLDDKVPLRPQFRIVKYRR